MTEQEIHEARQNLVIERMMRAGWIRKATVIDTQGIRSFDWTPVGIDRSREIHTMLVELGFRDERSVACRNGDLDILVEFTGDCVAHYGQNSALGFV